VLQKQECPPKLLPKYFLKPNFFLLHPMPMWSAAAASYTQHVLYTDVIQYLQTLLPVCNQFHRDYASWGYNCKICEQVLYEKLVMKLGIVIVVIMFCNNSSFTQKQGYNSSVPCTQFPNKQIARRTMKNTTASCPSSMIFTSPGYIVAQSPADLGSSIIEEGWWWQWCCCCCCFLFLLAIWWSSAINCP
jgi:hypothetical protein